MTQNLAEQVKEKIFAGEPYRRVARDLGISTSTVYFIVTGKQRKQSAKRRDPNLKRVELEGLSDDQVKMLDNVASNRDKSRNALLMSYVRKGLAEEPPQYKIYVD